MRQPMKRIAAILMIICMVVTGTCTGIPDRIATGNDMTAAAASTPALKAITYKATGNQRKDIIGFAKTQVGYKEGSNNNTAFGKWYGFNNNPWCAMFVCWSANKAGVSTSVIPKLATADRGWGKKQGIYHKSKQWGGSYTPKEGDLIYFSWSVRDWADHIGMVTGTGKSGGKTYVYTVEGNKHDKVVEASYEIGNKYILGYISPKYTTGSAPEEETQPTESGTYKLKYRDGLDATSDDEEDLIIPPVTGTFGVDQTLSPTKFTRDGYDYTKWKVYREVDGKLLYLCRDKETASQEQWYQKSAIPDTYSQVQVALGGILNIRTAVSGTIYVCPVWKKGSYTVSYDANGGSGAPAAQIKEQDKALTLSSTKPKRTGYSFQGWAKKKDASAADYKAGASYKDNASVTLYAVWKLDKYEAIVTDTVDTRTGAGMSYKKKATVEAGTRVTVTEVKSGWGKLADGSWIDLQYVSQSALTSYTLEYNDGISATTNDTSVIAPVTVKYGRAVTIANTRFTRDGYRYDAMKIYRVTSKGNLWYCRDKKTGSKEKWYLKDKVSKDYEMVKVKPGKTLTITQPVADIIKITPVWVTNVYKITYNANGGKGAPKKQTKKHGKTLTLRKGKPTRTGYTFKGWATSKSASKVKYKAGASYKGNADLKLYAVWSSKYTKVKTTTDVNKREGPGTSYKVIGTVAKGKTVTIVKKKNGWGKLKKGGWIDLHLTKTVKQTSKKSDSSGTEDKKASVKDQTFTVKVTSFGGVEARTGPGDDNEMAASYGWGEVLDIDKVKNGWGRIEDEDNWIRLSVVKISEGYRVETGEDLTQRSGPGGDYQDRGTLESGTYHISKINGDWGKIKETGYWVELSQTRRVEE